MPVESAADLAVFFNANEFGVAATYAVPGEDAVACTVIRDQSDQTIPAGSGRSFAQGRIFYVSANEIPRPVKGALFTVDGDNFKIIGDPQTPDTDRLVWRCVVVDSPFARASGS